MSSQKAAALMIPILLITLACSVSVDLFGNKKSTTTSTAAATLEEVTGEPVEMTVEAASTATELANATAAQMTQAIVNYAATETARFAVEGTPPPQSSPEITRQAGPEFSGTIQQLQEEGAIASTEGDYHQLDDYDFSFAQIDYYHWDETDFSPENFVIAADVKWSSASKTANWPNSGCGFVFSIKDDQNHDYAFLGLDGYVSLNTLKNDNQKEIAFQKIPGGIDIPEGSAKIMLVVSGKRISFYVNGEKVTSASDSTLQAGDLAYMVSSGTNKDFGTRCQFTNVNLWIPK